MQRCDDECVAEFLLMAHKRLLSAHNASHCLRAFVPFETLVQLLEDRILVPATFRYATQILASLLQHRYGAACIC